METQNKCPNCGSTLLYDINKGLISCDHCDSQYPVTPRRSAKIIRRYSPDISLEVVGDEVGQFFCNNCKTYHMVEPGKVSHRCPSCGGTNISAVKNTEVAPDGIIPFVLERDKATQIFDKWLKKCKFAPRDLQNMAKNGKLSAVYVPVYNFNGTSVCMYNGSAKKVHTDSSGTIYSTIHTVRDAEEIPINNQMYCANSAIDASLLNRVVAVDSSLIVPYSSEYLFGYYGAQTNLSLHDAYADLTKTYAKNNETKVRAKVKEKYDEILNLSANTVFKNVTFSHVYVPIYMNHYTYKNKDYHCYISGTDGSVAGKTPKSVGKIFAGIFAGLLVAAAVAVAIIVNVL